MSGSTCYLKGVVSPLSRRLVNSLPCPLGRLHPGRRIGVEGDLQQDPSGTRAEANEEGPLGAAKELGRKAFLREPADEALGEGIRPAPIRFALPGEEIRGIGPPESSVFRDGHEAELQQFGGNLAHGLSRETRPPGEFLERDAGGFEGCGKDRRAARRRQHGEQRGVVRIDEAGGKHARSLRLEESMLDEVPGMPASGCLGDREFAADVADPGTRSHAKIPKDLSSSGIREAASLPLEVFIKPLAGHRLLQGASEPTGHLKTPGTPGESDRGSLPVSNRGSRRPSSRRATSRGNRGRSSASTASGGVAAAGTAS